jgi:hypothetical protein
VSYLVGLPARTPVNDTAVGIIKARERKMLAWFAPKSAA